MDITAAADVAAGLVLMYLVLSLFCSSINELLASVLGVRSKMLAKALTQLIDNPNLKTAFDDHGLIGTSRRAAGGATAAPSYLSSRNVALALIGALDPSTSVTTIAQAQAAIAAMPIGTNIKDVLDNAVLEAGGDFDKFRDSLAGWFDVSMDRLSGVFKRYMQIISLFVGLAVAVAFNADTLHVGKALWSDRTLSAAFAQSAPDLANKLCADNACAAQPTGADVNTTVNNISAGLKSVDQNLHGLPIGWGQSGATPFWLWHITGILLTTIALAMGAPFWFDVLQKITNFRMTGDKPAKASGN